MTILELAERIAQDIRRRKLKAGQPYLGAQAAARRFRVSGTTANRALQLLAQRRMLRRRQRQGTQIAEPTGTDDASALQCVHLVTDRNNLQVEGLLAEGVLIGLQGRLPAAQLQFSFSPRMDPETHVRSLIDGVLASRQRSGFILVRATAVVQRLVQDTGLPAVVSGSLHPSIDRLAWIDRDQRRIGRLLVEHLVRRGARRLAVLLRERWSPGDHTMLEGAMHAVAQAGLPLGRLTLRSLPSDEAVIQADAMRLLSDPGPAVGFLCRSSLLADGVLAAAARLNKPAPKIVAADVYRPHSKDAPLYPVIRPTITPQQWGDQLGLMLARQAAGESPHGMRQIIPVELLVP
jgi:DNA-binding LacI/PurR family transcriptional regulator